MCTVSIVLHAGGVRLVCNRDERRTRARALAPRVHDLGGRRALFPVDPDGGGTWVGVNSEGLIAAVLNRTDAGSDAARRARGTPTFASRGAIVPHVLAAATLEEAMDRVASLHHVAFARYRLLVTRHRTLWIVTGGGTDNVRAERQPLLTSFVLASSSLGDRLVEVPRRRLFEHFVVIRRGAPLEAQAAFHAHRWRARPEISVVMSRADARTVSRTQIDIGAHTADGRAARGEASIGKGIAMTYREIPEAATSC
jgi:hypothetical protein